MSSNEFVIAGKKKDLGGFSVSRLLPTVQKRSIGPFIFLDQMGPMPVTKKHKLDVRPHPHIGLATVTYLFSGVGLHRDSLGSKQLIQPGDINWMTAGRGIVHSERTPPEVFENQEHQIIHGIQIWVGLPKSKEEIEPSFFHYPKNDLPDFFLEEKLNCKVLLGAFLDHQSPVKSFSKMLFVDFSAATAASHSIRFNEQEMAIMCIDGELEVNSQSVPPDSMIVLDPEQTTNLKFRENARFIAFGGDPFPEPRYMWWNFVSSEKQRIRDAAENWKNQKMGKVDEESEFIPLPTESLP
jgi:redox-sensitive bicupin YhaK (pirin superfamily)